MSIGPVQTGFPVGEAAYQKASHPQPHSATNTFTRSPQGNVPKQESPALKEVSSAPSTPQDEVQLQRDTQLEDELIVRYVDKAGNLILQVPSEQTLNLERSIAAEFQQEKHPAATEVVSQKGESHGH